MYLQNVMNVLVILLRSVRVCLLPFMEQSFPSLSKHKIKIDCYLWEGQPDRNISGVWACGIWDSL